MLSPRSPPSSPSKTKAFLRELVTGVQPTDTLTHQQRWGKRPPATAAPSPVSDDIPRRREGPGGRLADAPAPAPASPTRPAPSRVASLVQGYEAASLSSSRPYTSHPPSPSPPTPQSIPPPTSPTKAYAGRPSPSPTTSSTPPTVPASFFQQQQARRTPPAQSASPASPGKENRSVLAQTVRPSASTDLSDRPLFSPSKPSQREQSRPRTPSISEGSDASSCVTAFSSVTATSSAEEAVVVRAFVEPIRASTPTRIFVGATPVLSVPRIVQTAATPSRAPVAAQRPTSQFVEALPVSYPSRQSPPLVATPTLATQPTTSATQVRTQPDSRAQQESPRKQNDSPARKQRPVQHQQSPEALSRSYATYEPLPLAPSPAPVQKESRKARPRASTVGSWGREDLSVSQAESPRDRERRIEQDFDALLDTMQLPSRSVREKMAGLPTSMKQQMLSAKPATSLSHSRVAPYSPAPSSNLSASTNVKKEKLRPFLRKTKSSSNLAAAAAVAPARPTHARTGSATSLLRSLGRSTGAGAAGSVSSGGSVGEEDATWWAVRIRSTSCEALEVKEVGRLRGRLRNEPPVWVEEFIKHGGYTGLMERLKQLLDIEWREEQHDDQILHELLRCFKALTLTACGRRALASRSPTPFIALTSLLFSEKRPGDLPCRQILVELVHALFDVRPASACTITKAEWTTTIAVFEGADRGSGGQKRYTRKMKGAEDEDGDEQRMSVQRTLKVHEMVLSLVRGPPNEKEEAKVDFAKGMVRPRIFKTWVGELSDTVRDFFWVFCHSQNTIWSVDHIDHEEIEAPKVPSGMTGGVEYEAMAYCTTHFKLINILARTCPTQKAALEFHFQLFESGFEHVLFTLRRASSSYYQTLHLEMARYIALARGVQFLLPPRILGVLDARTLAAEERRSLDAFQRRHPVSRHGAPLLAEPSFS